MNKKYKGGLVLLNQNNLKCLCSLCNDHISLENGIVLKCGCCWHITCFIQYIVNAFKDKKHYFTNNGLKCITRKHWVNPVEFSISLDEVTELINIIREKNIQEMLNVSNMSNIIYNKFLTNINNKFFKFTQNNQIIKINNEEWANFGKNDSKEKNSQSLIDAITQKCPCGKGGAIHYHGHGCHAISCPACGIEFCYTCAGVNKDILETKSLDKNYHKCTCNPDGFLHTFCIDNDIEKNLIYVDVLRDRRCNCPICPDCKGPNFRKGPGFKKSIPCEICKDSGGVCVVCQGIIKKCGSTESKVKHSSTSKTFHYKKPKEKKEKVEFFYKDSKVEIPAKKKENYVKKEVDLTDNNDNNDNNYNNNYNNNNYCFNENYIEKILTTTRRRMTTPFTKKKNKK